ncbi:sulfotransferase family 2 domain-containing protein [Marinobacterium lacunae]|uniref:sulfotransferase family 2 domain-containing protein n=1 Tax=Marinobacterium lacunae TaxID=1232683 RepID=UPI000559BF71|nr:sulfotransferase family 2 domain-containing protein [Marinobacterium lacunae]
MLRSDRNKFIFIHVYKNAGTSITNALMPFSAAKATRLANKLYRRFSDEPSNAEPGWGNQPYRSHISAAEVRDRMGEEEYSKYFSFAFVRNPWDWQVSLYTYMLKKESHAQHELIKSLGSFEDYIAWRCEHEARFQKDFVYAPDGSLIVDFVGKYESLQEDFDTICKKISIDAKLPWLNVSKDRNYKQYYDEKTKNMVAETFKADIELFGYEF